MIESVVRGIGSDALSGVAVAATAVLQSIDLERLGTDPSYEPEVEDVVALEFPDRLIELGLEATEDAPDEVVEAVEESFSEPDSSPGIALPLAIGVTVVVGAFAFLVAIHNSLVAAESPEAERFISSFFDHMNFYVAIAFLMLALKEHK